MRTELAHWRSADLKLPIWWRDDDATAPTSQLDRLNAISEEVDVPVHLAVIPRDVTSDLVEFVAQSNSFVPVVHGWSHTNHQPAEQTKSEFGRGRPLVDRCDEARQGLRVVEAKFGAQAKRMFVPPWNRAADDLVAKLPDLGFRAFSTCNPRLKVQPVPGLTQINTHIDPLYWRKAKRLSDPDLIVDRAMRFLRRRRRGKSDATEPFGLLTHHLVHFPAVWEFCRQFWLEMREAPVEVFSMDDLGP